MKALKCLLGMIVLRWTTAGLVVVLFLSAIMMGCERGARPPDESLGSPTTQTAATQPRRPLLTFPAQVRAPYPEASAFLDEFLSVWLSADYQGYRRLVSRAHTPESRERFLAICEVTEAVEVESIEQLPELPALPAPAYRVVFRAQLSKEHQARRGEARREIAIVVFREQGKWWMATAPEELQPSNEPPPASSSAPAASLPSYPWDEEGDY